MVHVKGETDYEVYIECNKCGKRTLMEYGEWANNGVPLGWLRAPDDKTHYCSVLCFEATRNRQPMSQIHPGVGNVQIVSNITKDELKELLDNNAKDRMKRKESSVQEQSAQPNQMRIGDDIVDINEQGGKQSHIDAAAHRLDATAMLELIDVLGYGDAKYNEEMCAVGDENWRKLNHLDHINHALVHQLKYLRELQFGPKPGDPEAGQHLAHAFCRLMFALGSKPTQSANVVQAVNDVTGVLFAVDLSEIVMVEHISDSRCNLIFKDHSVTVAGSRNQWLQKRTHSNV